MFDAYGVVPQYMRMVVFQYGGFVNRGIRHGGLGRDRHEFCPDWCGNMRACHHQCGSIDRKPIVEKVCHPNAKYFGSFEPILRI